LAKIAELEARRNRTPQNSSLPPSAQHPHAKPVPERKTSPRNRGGQPGHPRRGGWSARDALIDVQASTKNASSIEL
jgi:hypothetical protein